MPIQKNLTYACVEGPRLETRAESFMLRDLGAQLIGMTNVPEAFLAREAQVCYASIGVVTDYDSWLEDRRQFATAEAVLEKYKASLSEVKRLLGGILDKFSTDNLCSCRRSLEHAFVTPRELFSSEQSELVSILMS